MVSKELGNWRDGIPIYWRISFAKQRFPRENKCVIPDPIGKLQERAKPGFMGAAKAFDGEPGVGSPDNGTDGADENVHEQMGLVIVIDAEVRTIAITIHQELERRPRFGSR